MAHHDPVNLSVFKLGRTFIGYGFLTIIRSMD